MDMIELGFALTPFIAVGFALGMMTNPLFRAKIQKQMGKGNPGIFFLKRKGKGVKMYNRDFSKDKIDVKEGSYPLDPEKVYELSGVSMAIANETNASLIDLEPKDVPINLNGKCPHCAKDFSVSIPYKQEKLNPKVYNDIIIGAINWGKSLVMNKILPTIILVVAISIVVGAIGAVLGYMNSQAIATANTKIDSLQAYIVSLNLTRGQ